MLHASTFRSLCAGVIALCVALPSLSPNTTAQIHDSVDVTFRYQPGGNPSLVHLPGEFNNWANNSSGAISPNPLWTMTKGGDGIWRKTLRLRVNGGQEAAGAYQYKFNENGNSGGWTADPWNPRSYGNYGNSIITVSKPTIFQITPVNDAVVPLSQPRIIAGVFPVLGSSIDTALSRVLVDGLSVGSFGASYHAGEGLLSFALPSLLDGTHEIVIVAVDSDGDSRRDSTRLHVTGSPLQWRTRSHPGTWDSVRTLRGFLQDSLITDVRISDGTSDLLPTFVSSTEFDITTRLQPGINSFVITGRRGSEDFRSSSLSIVRRIDSLPRPEIMLGGTAPITLNAYASTHPLGRAMDFFWRSEDSRNPRPLGLALPGAQIALPAGLPAGEYFFSLTATDDLGKSDWVRTYVSIDTSGMATISRKNTNPAWIKDAIVYEIFVPAFSPEGTINGVISRLPQLRTLGVNTLWLMPIFDNNGSVNAFNGGYDIVNFREVEPALGTRMDLLRLMDSCHAMGMRVILDITPNHVSDQHPWINDIRKWGEYSIYRRGVENRLLGDDRGLGQSVVSYQGAPLYARYSNWGLANLNLSDPDTRSRMLEVFRFWVDTMRADGYRMDVYWGPQNRYGSKGWWDGFRRDIKRYKPEVFILGETDGTGQGSEVNYADADGACDAAYDWSLFGQFKSTLSGGDVSALHNRITNYSPTHLYNHYTGPGSHYLRFLENHDETRIAQVHAADISRTLPAATVLLTAPGIPMIYAGQEVGWQGQRNTIDFDRAPGRDLLPVYTTLISLRRSLSALRSPRIIARPNGTARVYSYVRPEKDENVLILSSFSSIGEELSLSLSENELERSSPLLPTSVLYLNECLKDSISIPITGEGLSQLRFSLKPWESRVYVITDSAWFNITDVQERVESIPESPRLISVFPNPWTPSTGAARIQISHPESHSTWQLRVEVIDMLGRVRVIRSERQGSGMLSLPLTKEDLKGSGFHVVRLLWTSPRDGRNFMQSLPLVVYP